MNKNWKWNPKIKGSGIIECIPQKGLCPQKCKDCFFQSGRSYLEPLLENLPHVPDVSMTEGRIVRVNDGHDSNVERDLVETATAIFKDKFFNTSIPKNIGGFPAPVVLTVNPSTLTDTGFHKLDTRPVNLMFIRIRANVWNIETVIEPAIEYYTNMGVAVVLTFMAYYKEDIPKHLKHYYIWKQRTLNSYWCLTQDGIDYIMGLFKENPLVYSCGYKGQFACSFCGNCIREYYNAKERITN